MGNSTEKRYRQLLLPLPFGPSKCQRHFEIICRLYNFAYDAQALVKSVPFLIETIKLWLMIKKNANFPYGMIYSLLL